MKYKDLPPFSALALKKPEELVQILTDSGFKIPKDSYYVKTILSEGAYRDFNIIFIIRKKYAIRLRDKMSLSIWKIEKEDINCINDIIRGIYRELEERSNPIGPAVFWFQSQEEAYFINDKKLTKERFERYMAKQRIRSLPS